MLFQVHRYVDNLVRIIFRCSVAARVVSNGFSSVLTVQGTAQTTCQLLTPGKCHDWYLDHKQVKYNIFSWLRLSGQPYGVSAASVRQEDLVVGQLVLAVVCSLASSLPHRVSALQESMCSATQESRWSPRDLSATFAMWFGTSMTCVDHWVCCGVLVTNVGGQT